MINPAFHQHYEGFVRNGGGVRSTLVGEVLIGKDVADGDATGEKVHLIHGDLGVGGVGKNIFPDAAGD